ncbi:hypothetical protein E2320_019596 [Naja naja]|nr:hypothetical protein E2320_019596 [Naja naja]
MPDQISVSEFVSETNEDYKSPTASNFTTRMVQCRNTVTAIEEGYNSGLFFIDTSSSESVILNYLTLGQV